MLTSGSISLPLMWFTCQPLLVSSSIFANQYIWKRPWCWEGLGAGGEGDNRGWDGWMALPTRWTWVWVNSRIGGRRRRGQQRMRWLDDITNSMDMSWVNFLLTWWTGRPGMLRFMGSQRVGHDWATELTWFYTWSGPSADVWSSLPTSPLLVLDLHTTAALTCPPTLCSITVSMGLPHDLSISSQRPRAAEWITSSDNFPSPRDHYTSLSDTEFLESH